MPLLAALSLPVRAADQAAPDVALLRVAFGTLQKHKTAAGERYVLVDAAGQVSYGIAPSDGIELDANVGQAVQVVGKLESEGGSPQPLLLAQAIQPKIAPPAQFVSPQSAVQADQDGLPPLTPLPESSSSDAARSSSAGGAADSSRTPGSSRVIIEGDPLDESLLNEPGIVESVEPQRLMPAADPWHAAPCGQPEWLWAQAGGLAWWTREMTLPPLVTTSPVGTPQIQAGVIGAADTHVLFGDRDLFSGVRYGSQFRLGGWIGPRRWVGLELDYTGLRDADTSFVAASVGDQILARPFFNVGPNTMSSDAALIAYPNLLAGTVEVDVASQFQSAGFHLVTNLLCTCGVPYPARRDFGADANAFRLDLLGGYRYIGLDESVVIRDYLVTTVTPRTGLVGFDEFATGNDFHGGELGLVARYQRRRWWTEGLLKLALGRTREALAIDGQTQIVVPPDSQNGDGTLLIGDLLAQSTNIGRHTHRATAWAADVGLSCGYELTPHLSVKLGYSLIFLSRVIRPDGAIDLGVNETVIPDPTDPDPVLVGPSRPAVAFNDTYYWAQGFQVGLDYRW